MFEDLNEKEHNTFLENAQNQFMDDWSGCLASLEHELSEDCYSFKQYFKYFSEILIKYIYSLGEKEKIIIPLLEIHLSLNDKESFSDFKYKLELLARKENTLVLIEPITFKGVDSKNQESLKKEFLNQFKFSPA